MLEMLSKARSFRNYSETGLDAVFASTSPARWMDIERADAAVRAIREIYVDIKGDIDSPGDFFDYKGLWIAGGWLGGLPYEQSQRKGIFDTFIKRGVDPERI